MTKPTYHELRRAFLAELRKLLADHPEACAAIEAYSAYEPPPVVEARAARGDTHVWHEYTLKPADYATAPKPAKTTLSKADCKARKCDVCGTISNRAYPYWFKRAKSWDRTRPDCVAR